MGSDYLFFDRYKTTDFHHGGKRRPTSKPRAPLEKGNGSSKCKKGGRSRFHGEPALVLGEAVRAPAEKQNAPVCKTQASARKLKKSIQWTVYASLWF